MPIHHSLPVHSRLPRCSVVTAAHVKCTPAVPQTAPSHSRTATMAVTLTRPWSMFPNLAPLPVPCLSQPSPADAPSLDRRNHPPQR